MFYEPIPVNKFPAASIKIICQLEAIFSEFWEQM